MSVYDHNIQTVDFVADLANVSMASGQLVQTLGYYAASDGGANVYRYDSGSAAAIDGGFVLDGPGSVGRFLAVDQTVANARQFGAKGDGVTDDTSALQSAMDSHNIIYIPKGVFIITDALYPTLATTDYLVYGDGSTSVIKRGDGSIDGDFQYMLRIEPANAMNKWEVRDLRLENNQSNNVEPASLDWEHCHTITSLSDFDIDHLSFRNITIDEPVADGINNSTIKVKLLTVTDCAETNRVAFRSSIQMSGAPETLIVSGFSGDSVEAEVIPSLNSVNTTRAHITNSRFKTMDLSFGSTGRELVRVLISNTYVSESTSIGNCTFEISNCDFVLPSTGQWAQFGENSTVANTILRCQYDEGTGAVTPFNPYCVGGTINQEVTFTGCQFLINYPNGALPVAATGYLIYDQQAFSDGNDATAIRRRNFINCTFDSRAEGSVYCYRNGYWYFEGCTFASASGRGALHMSTSNGYKVSVIVNGGDCRYLNGDFQESTYSSNDYGQVFKMYGNFLGASSSALVTSSQQPANAAGYDSTRVIHADAIPTDGHRGDVIALGSSAYGAGNRYMCTYPHASGSATYSLIGQNGILKGATGSRPIPSANDIGLQYLDTTLAAAGQMIWWNGSAWVDATGTTTP